MGKKLNLQQAEWSWDNPVVKVRLTFKCGGYIESIPATKELMIDKLKEAIRRLEKDG